MSIATEISRIQSAKADIKAAIEAKGVTVPSSATIDYYGTYINNIPSVGGDNTLIKSIKIEDFTGTTFNRSTSYITSVTIPDSVTSIAYAAFQNCTSLASIDIPSGVTSIGSNVFQNCTSLTSINIPSGVTSISNYAFYSCYGLTSISIPSGVTNIGNYTFANCTGLTSINIPSGVTSIGSNAFQNCISLTSITIKAITPPTLGSNVFASTNDCPIYVPANSVDAYKSATNWSTYASRIQAIPT